MQQSIIQAAATMGSVAQAHGLDFLYTKSRPRELGHGVFVCHMCYAEVIYSCTFRFGSHLAFNTGLLAACTAVHCTSATLIR